jgi:hypothetical protein
MAINTSSSVTGSLIEHQLFPSSTLRRALSFILEAMQKPVNSKVILQPTYILNVIVYAIVVCILCRDKLASRAF